MPESNQNLSLLGRWNSNARVFLHEIHLRRQIGSNRLPFPRLPVILKPRSTRPLLAAPERVRSYRFVDVGRSAEGQAIIAQTNGPYGWDQTRTL